MARCAMNTLNMHVFTSATEASVRLAAFRHHYNEEHPHSELDDQTPSEFKRAWVAAQQKDETTLQFQRVGNGGKWSRAYTGADALPANESPLDVLQRFHQEPGSEPLLKVAQPPFNK